MDSCGLLEIISLEDEIEEVIELDSTLINVFGSESTRQLINPKYFSTTFRICDIDTVPQLIELIDTVFYQYLAKLDSTGHSTEYEMNFLDSLFTDISKDFNDTIKVDPSSYYLQVINNEEQFYNDGELAYTLLIIYDYSWCFWNEELWSQYKLPKWVKTAAKILGVGGPVSDYLGAYVGAIENLIETNGEYDPNNDFVDAMARGAVSGSAGVIGILLD